MTAVAWNGGTFRFLDQTLLPHEEKYIDTCDHRVVAEAIAALRIRGAPAIGVAAAFGLVLALTPGSTLAEMRRQLSEARKTLAGTRPTAVNLFHALERMQRTADCLPERTSPEDFRKALLEQALEIQQEDIEACRKIGQFGASLIVPHSSVLTHCNAGALATAGQGTALSVITTAAGQGKIVRVYADETRPLLQGARLTSWELVKAGIDVVLITDNTAGWVLRKGKVQAVVVGADRIARNGDTANKIGTYPLAVLARRHGVPFYVAAPTSTLDAAIGTGEDIVIEERDPAEVTHVAGKRIAPEGVNVFAPAFDVTPNDLITAIVSEKGIAHPPFAESLACWTEQKKAGTG